MTDSAAGDAPPLPLQPPHTFPPSQVERISQFEARHAQLLDQLSEPVQQHFRRRQREAAPSDAALRWSFPPPILDEAAFREEHAGAGSSSSSEED